MVPLILIIVAIVIAVAGFSYTGRRAPGPAPSATFNVELNEPSSSTAPFELACPHCRYMIALEDLSVVGQSLGCPLCEGVFMVLEPESEHAATTVVSS